MIDRLLTEKIQPSIDHFYHLIIFTLIIYGDWEKSQKKKKERKKKSKEKIERKICLAMSELVGKIVTYFA